MLALDQARALIAAGLFVEADEQLAHAKNSSGTLRNPARNRGGIVGASGEFARSNDSFGTEEGTENQEDYQVSSGPRKQHRLRCNTPGEERFHPSDEAWQAEQNCGDTRESYLGYDYERTDSGKTYSCKDLRVLPRSKRPR